MIIQEIPVYVLSRICTINYKEKICRIKQDVIKATWVPDLFCVNKLYPSSKLYVTFRICPVALVAGHCLS